MRRIVLYGEARRAGDWGGLGIEREMAIDYSRDHREINKLEEACWPNNYIMLGGCAHISYPDLSIEEGEGGGRIVSKWCLESRGTGSQTRLGSCVF